MLAQKLSVKQFCIGCKAESSKIRNALLVFAESSLSPKKKKNGAPTKVKLLFLN